MTATVVIGAGQAGAALAARLRALGHDGPLTLIGDEPAPPYQRPPLSKAYLLGDLARERLFLRPAEFYAEQGIDLRTGVAVTDIDPQARRLRLADGSDLAYDRLALTTGGAPRRLPAAAGGDLAGVHVLRGIADADALGPALVAGARMVVIGGGYVGLEVAAVAAGRGLDVTLIEAAPRILQRVAAPETSDYFRNLHSARGVRVIEGAGGARLVGAGRVEAAELADGTRIAADVAVIGIGIAPSVGLAAAAGLALDNGIACDAEGRTTDPCIWAAGDCASFPVPGGRLRLESVQNAIDMAEAVAANMLGAGRPYVPQPWFWSDQYDVKLQIAGLCGAHDRVVVRVAPDAGAEGARSHWYFAGPRLLAVDAMNDARAFMVAKRLLAEGRSPEPAAIADPATDLRVLLRA